MVFALLCWGSSLFIPRDRSRRAGSAVIDANIVALDRRGCCEHLRSDERLWWGALVTSWFWLVGAVVLSLLPPLVKNVLGGTEEVVTAYLADVLDRDRDRLGPRGLARARAASSCCRP